MTRQPGRPTARPAARRHSPRVTRDRQINRLLLIGGAVLILLVIAIPGAAYYLDVVAKGQALAIKVEGTSYSMDDFVNRLAFRDRLLTAQFAGLGDPQLQQFLQQQRASLTVQVKNELIESVLIQQEAERRGITITNEDVDKTIQDEFGGATRNNIPRPDASPSPEAAMPTPTPDPAEITQRYQTFLKQSGTTEEQFRGLIRNDLLRQKLTDAIKAEVPDTAEQVRLRAIVLPAQNDATRVLEQVQGGADFAALAAEKSTDEKSKTQGGQFDWIARGTRDQTFDDKVFNALPGLIPEVIQELGGYAVIDVQEKDPSRPLPEDQRTTLQNQAFTKWLDERKKSAAIEDKLTPEDQLWAQRRAERQNKFATQNS